MAVGWLSVLKWVPWGEVISHAPKIADRAVKLWGTVAKSRTVGDGPPAKVGSPYASDDQAVAQLHAQLAVALTGISELHTQVLASSELIKALAEQNAQLVKRIEINHMRMLWLAGGMIVLVVLSGIGFAIVLSR